MHAILYTLLGTHEPKSFTNRPNSIMQASNRKNSGGQRSSVLLSFFCKLRAKQEKLGSDTLLPFMPGKYGLGKQCDVVHFLGRRGRAALLARVTAPQIKTLRHRVVFGCGVLKCQP